MNSLVSIITPNYNSEKFIAQTLQSIRAQTYKNWELIIVDDCSTDKSLDIIETYSKTDKRIKVIRLNENSGAGIARNKAIEEATGNFIAFLDSDDLWHPEKLEKQLAFMVQKNYNLTYTSYNVFNEKDAEPNKIVLCKPTLNYSQMLYSNKIGCLTAMYNKDNLGKIYMPEIRKRQDYALWLKILKKEERAYGLQEVLACYRDRSNSISNNKVEMLKWNWILYKKVEELSYFQSLFYVTSNVLNKIF
ncbi:glycosyltransferase family 2 protein [Polaribacter sp. IC073]|uniref:glycosyltransferase family 2 protein n=1 Tax=Polaribacter sp. IC073 TaxID=2508540 RepID=UPI0011BFAFD2|nr:glycosyltransferase family 2 protein [Polaribacter sp. IC073]TXD49139.1 glycosyltransferase family 2 protein [Polaribacter sp. IC073]